MRSFRKLTVLTLGALIVGSAALSTEAATKEDKAKEKEKRKAATKQKEEKKGAEKKGAGDDGKGKMALPLIEGHDAKGLKIPYTGTGGQLQMIFTIGVASRIDPDHVQMADLQVETFDEAGKSEMVIDLPQSVLDLNTRILTSSSNVKIRRDDFEITGEKMEFNTQTKQGQIAGNVRMLLYDPDEKNAAAAQVPPVIPPPEPARE